MYDAPQYKVLIAGQSYMKCMELKRMLNWAEEGFRVILEQNICSCETPLERVNPDILILVGVTGWMDVKVIIDSFAKKHNLSQIIVVCDEKNPLGLSNQIRFLPLPSRRSCCGAVLTRFMFRPIWRLSSWAMWTRRLPHGLHRSVCRRTSRRRLRGLAAKRNLRAHSGTERAGNSRSASRCFLLAFGQSRPQSHSGRNSRDSLPPNCCWAKVQRYMKAFIHAA